MNTQIDLYGRDLFGEPITPTTGILRNRFIVPPFTVFDARAGEWLDRKAQWRLIGVTGMHGRSEGINFYSDGNNMKGVCTHITEGVAPEIAEKFRQAGSGVGDFDPCLAEVLLSWFSKPGDVVLDPFAGGAVRGLMTGILDRKYIGIDIRPEQIDANKEVLAGLPWAQSADIKWVGGDSMELVPTMPRAQFLLTCPPYGDLEIYSKRPGDISQMDFHAFSAAYKRIIMRCVAQLDDNCFAAFVVGNFRDKKGRLRDLVGLTVSAFEEQGAHLHNDIVLVTPVGSAAIRASAQFEANLKLCRTHQMVLVFCKGDYSKATKRLST